MALVVKLFAPGGVEDTPEMLEVRNNGCGDDEYADYYVYLHDSGGDVSYVGTVVGYERRYGPWRLVRIALDLAVDRGLV